MAPSLIPASRMTTRPRNKNVHPGVVDLPSPKRHAAMETEEERQAKAEMAAKESEKRTAAAKKVAAITEQLSKEKKSIQPRSVKERSVKSGKEATICILIVY